MCNKYVLLLQEGGNEKRGERKRVCVCVYTSTCNMKWWRVVVVSKEGVTFSFTIVDDEMDTRVVKVAVQSSNQVNFLA